MPIDLGLPRMEHLQPKPQNITNIKQSFSEECLLHFDQAFKNMYRRVVLNILLYTLLVV